jgi:hypothetical protein
MWMSGRSQRARAARARRTGVRLWLCLALAFLGQVAPCHAQIVQLRGLRAVFGAGYEQANSKVVDGYQVSYDDNLFSPLLTLQGSVAVLDPGIFNLDATVDLRVNLREHRSTAESHDDNDRLGNARLDMTILSGRGAPLRLYYARSDSRFQQRPLTADVMPLDLARFGEARTKGFSWDVSPRRLPRVALMGFMTRRRDYGNMLAGQDNNSRMTRFEARANQMHQLARYEVSFTRDSTGFDYPLNGISSNQGIDFLRATTTVTPAKTLAIDLSARGSRFDFSAGDGIRRSRGFSGWGGDTAVRWNPSRRWEVTGSYSMSTNLAEMALSSSAGAEAAHRVSLPGQPEGTTTSISRRSLYQEGSGWLRRVSDSRSTTIAVGVHALSLDPLPLGMATLDVLRTINASADHRLTAASVEVSAGAEAAYGEVRSSRGERSDYAEGGARLRLGRQSGRLRPAIEGGVRRTTAPYFYPVGGNSWNAGADIEVGITRTATLRAGARQSEMVRDVVVQRGKDRTRAYTAGLTGPRFDVTFEYGDTDSTAVGLVETWLLQEVRPDQLLLTRPDLFGLLYATTQRSRMLSARLNVARGLDVFARGRLDLRQYVGSYDLDQQVVQAGIVWGVRALQLEAGWEQLRYASAFVTSTDKRLYVRVRRDVLIR